MVLVQAVGMDLGTTYSAVAIVGEDGQARAIPNAEGMLTTPSVALWDGARFLVGQPALDFVQQAGGDERERRAAALIRGVKRMIGNPPKGGLISNGYRTSPVEVSAAILAKLARDATPRLGFQVQRVVITVPAHFGDRERSETKAAAEMAGLVVLQMINEPSAAALTYTRGQQAEPGTTVVFDLGGGTFDATVLQLGEKEARVLATHGIEELGGINFTNDLARMLRRRYETLTKTSYAGDSLSADKLVAVAEMAKCDLSSQEKTVAKLAPGQGPALDVEVTRAQFEDLIDLSIYQLRMTVETAVERARKTPTEITRVLLCGGSARIPAVQAMLADLFGRRPEQTLDLDLSVALGAAYQAFNCAQKEQAQMLQPGGSGLQLLAGLVIDCVSYPVGIAVLDASGQRYLKLVMLRQGDPLDRWSNPFAVRVVGPTRAFPPIAVYKGESEDLEESDFLGTITLALPPGTQQGARATVRMLQDQSGLIQVQLALDGKELPGSLQRPQI
ncbi:MAG TPA: Hsp70 family protein [Ktedonobacteraceae bacterium]|nr:Hsp70 family protein [Ktedonobacteraceae bacterium]